MSDVLKRICADKLKHVASRKASHPLSRLEAQAAEAPPVRGFARRLADALAVGSHGLICEIKKASPTRGLIRADFDPVAIAQAYARGGASCISVLTDAPYFQGDDAHLTAARAAVALPVLRKDFVLDPYQVTEARAMGADCILLIMAALDDGHAALLAAAAHEHGMDVLVEVHDADEMRRALMLEADLVGINNRNLRTLTVDLGTTEVLASMAPPDRLLVSESGLASRGDLDRMAAAGARCFLVGESLMREKDIAGAVQALVATPAPAGVEATA
jgi:indole-3-glycerol phosphate synthase